MSGVHKDVAAVVLAAGMGKRMKSDLAKVLHEMAGRPLLAHVLDTLDELGVARTVVVIGHQRERVQAAFAGRKGIEWAVQDPQRGTGHACMMAEPALGDFRGTVLVVCGDTPLLTARTLGNLLERHAKSGAQVTCLSMRLVDPKGYGRIVRTADGHGIERIVEEKDATPAERTIDEVNSGIFAFDHAALKSVLSALTANNAQGEYYLTDVVAVLRQAGHVVDAIEVDDPMEVVQVNDRAQLAIAEAELRARINDRWMRAGVTMVDPAQTYIDATVELEHDVRIQPNTTLEGRTVIGTGSTIGPNVRLTDAVFGERVQIMYSVGRECEVGDDCEIGPFAYLRPGTRLAAGVKVGTYVEVKNADIGAGTKVPHLSYVGDADIGENSNLGASTITANYDGVNKHRTKIGDDVHTGIHTSLVAPVEVGDGAETGAGSVVTHDVEPGRHVRGIPARDTRAAREDES